jgi:hypothetical protein
MDADEVTTWSPPGEGERWLIELTYPDEYRKVLLKLLAAVYASSQCTLVIRGERLLLASCRFDTCADGNQAWHAAFDLVRLINALGYEGSKLNPALEVGCVFVERGAILERWRVSPEIHGVYVIADCGEYDLLASPAVTGMLLKLQNSDPEVKAAIELWSRPRVDWGDMYKMHEIISTSCPSQALPALKAAAAPARTGERSPDNKFEDLLQCAQHHAAVGITGSRHYASSGVPRRVVDRVVAEHMMDRLFREWLLYRVKQVLLSQVCAVLPAPPEFQENECE